MELSVELTERLSRFHIVKQITTRSTLSILMETCGLGFLFAAFFSTWTQADDAKARGDAAIAAPSFSKDIAPIFAKKCLKCHGAEKPKGGFQLHSFEHLMKPGDSKSPSIFAGDPGKSELYRRITTSDEDDRMPQKDDPLSASQIASIERWIKAGAPFDGADSKALLVTLIPREPYPDPPASYRFPIPVTALAFNSDGHELFVSGYHEITVWEPEQGKLLRRIKSVAERTYALACSPDGTSLAAAGGAPGQIGEVALYNPALGTVVNSLGVASDVMLTLCFSPDGLRIAAGGADNTIHIYNVASGKEELVIQQHADWVMALAFSPDGGKLASASRDRSARVYNSKSGELETSYNDHGVPVQAVAFDDEGKRVFSAGKDKRIHIWSVADAKRTGEMTGFDGEIIKLLIEGHSLFSCGTDKMIRQHDVSDRSLVRTYSGHKDFVYSLAIHSATKRLASGSHDGEVRVWNIEDGKLQVAFNAAPGYLTAEAKR